jgi:hypothetical protein
MRTPRLAAAMISLIMACWAWPALLAQTVAETSTATDVAVATAAPAEVDRRVRELEKQVEELRRQVAALTPSPVPVAAHEAAPATAAQQAVAAPAATPAPDPLSGLASVLNGATFNGLVDVYYGFNVNQPHNHQSGFRAFDGPSNQFALNMVELVLDKTPDPNNSRLGYHVGVGFGQAINVVNGTDPGGLGFAQFLKEAYFSYLAPAGKGLQVDVGKFVTPHGAEVIETNANWNYSRGLLFTYAIPYYHFGMRAKYTFSDKYSLTGFLVNGWNNVVDNNSGKTVGASFGWNPNKKLAVTQNYMVGPEMTGTNSHWRQLTDTVVAYNLTSKLTLQTNFDYGRGDHIPSLSRPVYWTGVAGYVRYVFNPLYAVATRYEYYNDHDGFTTGTAQHISEVTGTFERRIAHHLITRLELRHDESNRPVFLRGETPVGGQTTVAGGLVYVLEPGK